MSRWLQVDVERLLYVHRGRNVILCDRQAEFIGPLGGTLVVRVSAEAERKLCDEFHGSLVMRNDLGVVKSVGRMEDDEGRTVLRAIVDFYDGACPPLTFETVWSRIPVTIVEVRDDANPSERATPESSP